MPGFARVRFFMICFSLAFYACEKTQPQDPVSAGDLSGIDPDQKAIPKDVPVETKDSDVPPQEPQARAENNSEAKPTTDVSSEDTSAQAASDYHPREATDEVPVGSPNKVGTGPQTRFIKAATLNIRVQPNRFSKIVGTLKGGDEVHVKIHDGWAKLEEGRWIRSRWLVKSPPSGFSNATDEESVITAKRSKSESSKKKKSKKKK